MAVRTGIPTASPGFDSLLFPSFAAGLVGLQVNHSQTWGIFGVTHWARISSVDLGPPDAKASTPPGVGSCSERAWSEIAGFFTGSGRSQPMEIGFLMMMMMMMMMMMSRRARAR